MLQYSGFAVVSGGREYSFRVFGQDRDDRSFTVVIRNASFAHGLLKYQEAPDFCYRKLLSALAAEKNDEPLNLRQQVTESEVTQYTASGVRGVRWTQEQRLAAKQGNRATRLERGMR